MTFKDSLGLLDQHLSFVTKLNRGECVIKIDEVDAPFFIQSDLVKDELWGLENEITNEILKKKTSYIPPLESIDFQLSTDSLKPEEIELIISELNYLKNEKTHNIYFPTKQQCLKFPNFEELLWKNLETIYSFYDYCSNCHQLVYNLKNKDQCPDCSELLDDIKYLKVSLFQDLINEKVIKRNIELNILYKKYNRNPVDRSITLSFDKILNEALMEAETNQKSKISMQNKIKLAKKINLELRNLPGIGDLYANKLGKKDIRTIEDLLKCDEDLIAKEISGITIDRIIKWKKIARKFTIK